MNKKKRIPLNPFVLTGYVSPDYFCDRQKETDKIISALLNGRNITLTSPRRMGKTIYTKLSSHTWYVHTLLNRLYETGYETINKDTVDEILSDILLENEGSFQTFLRLVTPIQTRMAC